MTSLSQKKIAREETIMYDVTGTRSEQKNKKCISVTASKETMAYGVTTTKESHSNSQNKIMYIMSLLCKAL